MSRWWPLLVALSLLPAPAQAEIALRTVITGLASPVRLVAPEGDERLFVVQRGGLIRIFGQDGTDRGVFLDLSEKTLLSSERGLLGLAFAPDFATSGTFYVGYTDNSPSIDTRSEIWRYRVGANPDRADVTSGELVLDLYQPASNHNGGHLEFGPDGMLYAGFGDGGGGGDVDDNAQNASLLLGKMVRLDVSGPGPGIAPADNPFVGLPPLDEIWALGLRNPWCFSFDRLTGDLYITDVGQERREEINVQPAGSPGGENYGWRLMEGSLCYNPPTECDDGTLTLPVHEYAHGTGDCSISGGYVYRGEKIPAEQGAYFFADFCSNRIWSLRWTGAGGLESVTDRTAELTAGVTLSGVSSFGQDGNGELYVIENLGGRIHRIVDPNASPAANSSVGQLKGRW